LLKAFGETIPFHLAGGAAWLLAHSPLACHNTPCIPYIGSIIVIVEGIISRLNKNPNAYLGCSKEPGYAYRMLKRRRKLFKESYKFDPKMKEGIKK